MTPQQHQRVTELLFEVERISSGERRSFLEQSCGDDAAVRLEVEALLAQEVTDPVFFEEPIALSSGGGGEPPEGPVEGRRIGSYVLVEKLAEGGMGEVYLAARDGAFNKRVALKLIKQGMSSPEVRRRFDDERQILAGLEHPGIARILDGGTAGDGQPYYVMEHVEGEPIDRYCEHHGLSVRQRLELFRKVCSAVDAAHQRLVVHRDLKPANILVTGDGEPKLLDFGIAKIVDPGSPGPSLHTVLGGSPMTFKHASPEQVRRAPVTTASDTFALGVLLYKLLTGRRPFEQTDFVELTRAICEQDPDRPSTVAHHLDRDLDSIVLKAMRKDPAHRYSSVERLSDDIHRYLVGLPVRAHEGTFAYRAGKLVRRHKLAALAAMTILGLAVVAVGEREQAKVAQAQADTAEKEILRQKDRAEQMVGFLKGLFEGYRPDVAQGEEPTPLEFLDKAKGSLKEIHDGEVKATFLATLGSVYRDVGKYEEARLLMQEAVESLRVLYPGEHPDLAKAINNLGGVFYRSGDYDEAEALYSEVLEMSRALGPRVFDVDKPMCNLATILTARGAYTQAEELYQECFTMRVDAYGSLDKDVATSVRSLGSLYFTRGDLEQAEPLLRCALGMRRQLLDPQGTSVAAAHSSLGRVLLALGDGQNAERHLVEALAIREKRLPEKHAHIALTRKDLAELLLARGDAAAARPLLEQALAALEEAKSEGAWEVAEVEGLLCTYLVGEGRYAEAETCLLASAREIEQARGPHAVYTHKARQRLAGLYAVWGKPHQAAEQQALASARWVAEGGSGSGAESQENRSRAWGARLRSVCPPALAGGDLTEDRQSSASIDSR